MIAYLDAEFNCGVSSPDKTHDSSLIEVALIIVENLQSNKVIAQYHSFCKPMLNHGRLYPIIKGMTHISQADVNAGPRYPQVYEDLKELVQKYELTAIYVWGNFDRRGFIWNCARYPEIKDASILTDLIVDISKDCINTIGVTYDMALKDIAYICSCMTEKAHNAGDDTKMLADVAYAVYNGLYDRQKVQEYTVYLKQRDAYNALKKAVQKVQQAEGNLEQFMKMAEQNMGFPRFIYQKDQQ